MLSNLLNKLSVQETENLFNISVVVVDNDIDKSAETVVSNFIKYNTMSVTYFAGKENNISLARNTAISNASGGYVALIDDDEFPEKAWLVNLYKTIQLYDVDGVLGPVKPYFPAIPPEWISKGKICERPSYETGRIMKNDFRTGNALLNKKIFMDETNYFDPKYGKLGGEDVDFFNRITRKGFVNVWCDEAVVYEYVQGERLEILYYVKRYMRIGGITGEKCRASYMEWSTYFYLMKIMSGLFLYILLLPISICIGKTYFIKFLMKAAHNMSCISGFFGFKLIKSKD